MDAEFEIDPDPRETADRLRELGEAANRGQEEAGEEIALRVLADARRHVAVDEGRLRSSIDYEVDAQGNLVVIRVGSNVFYAEYQEVTQPYLRPAISENEEQIDRILIEMIQNAAQEAGLE